MPRTSIRELISYKIAREEKIVTKNGWAIFGYDRYDRPIYFKDDTGYKEMILYNRVGTIVYFRNNLGLIRDDRSTDQVSIDQQKQREIKSRLRTNLLKDNYNMLKKVGFSKKEAEYLKHSGKKIMKRILQEKAKEKITNKESLFLKSIRRSV